MRFEAEVQRTLNGVDMPMLGLARQLWKRLKAQYNVMGRFSWPKR
jgi:hypothetical protein